MNVMVSKEKKFENSLDFFEKSGRDAWSRGECFGEEKEYDGVVVSRNRSKSKSS